MDRMHPGRIAENEMLRYKPSQIHLTPADVGGLDQRRTINKDRACPDASTARLSAGPRLPTIIAAAHPHDKMRHPLEGTWDSHPRHRRRQTSPDVLPMRAGREVFRELPGASKARHQGEIRTHGNRVASPRARHTHASPVNIPTDLDPGAPVFTPRVRFGSTTVVTHLERIDSPSLRLQAPSEQNISPDPEGRPQVSSPVQESRPRRLRSNSIVSRPRRSSDNALALPNLDRYPLLIPSNRSPRSPQPEASNPQPSPGTSSENDSTLPTASSSRIPSIVSAASGISSLSISDDAAAEFLKFRTSPLDGLTAELSRLSTALGPAPIATEDRVSLLNGNPFDCSMAFYDETVDSLPLPDAQVEDAACATPKTAVSPGQPLHTDSPIHPTSPKLPVYNDATPARLQPQTPADVQRSHRRVHKKSDSSAHREAFCVGQVLVAPQRPAIPERRAFRNTYPASENTNAVEGHLGGLESEREVYVRRRQGGSLDVTPPGQGRFERLLD